ncbi:hypothetical protein [Bacillus sp. AFS053548]|uniref:hypothetical protein n=1 Tax=Bacillus sp. AFS053548 TaxID=2033505 RepID=UPI000BFD909C|nr:hypothetical protein [Bacillus sp. AFS053548]PGM59516.1 hypothetical protein CN946_00825 [Bacillus sp. AFS053548]
MSIILEFILDVIGEMLTPSSSSREFNKQQNERMKRNINLLSNLHWFSTLLENDERCKELFLRKLDEASNKFFIKYFQ